MKVAGGERLSKREEDERSESTEGLEETRPHKYLLKPKDILN